MEIADLIYDGGVTDEDGCCDGEMDDGWRKRGQKVVDHDDEGLQVANECDVEFDDGTDGIAVVGIDDERRERIEDDDVV